MKKGFLRIIPVLAINILSNTAYSQTANEVISKYIDAIGGGVNLEKLTSLYIECEGQITGRDVILKSYTLNGEGYRSELIFLGIGITEAYNDSIGWSLNILRSNPAYEKMSDECYNTGKHLMFIGSPFLHYNERGYLAEITEEDIDNIVIKMTSPDDISSFHYFNKETGYLVKTKTRKELAGLMQDNTIFYYDYREVNGIKLPFNVVSGQGFLGFSISSMITKVEANMPMDKSLFVMPENQPVPSEIKNKVHSVLKPVYQQSEPVLTPNEILEIEIPNTRIISSVIEQQDSTCRVTAIITHPPFDDEVTVNFALPLRNWNGRFMGLGGGGFSAGSVTSLDGAVLQGFAAGVTDGGHKGMSGRFAYDENNNRMNWQAIRNFSHLAIHDMTVVGKALVQALYGKPAKYSYFVGGSTGGRQAMNEVQRYPDDYNGVLANYPAIYYGQILMGFLWPQAVMNDMKNYVSSQKIKAVTDAVIAVCDGDDGVLDGVIEDPLNCSWDPGEFVGTKVGNEVFTAADATVVRRIWEGPRGYNDKFLWYGLTKGSNLLVYSGTKGDPLTGMPDYMAVEWVKYFLLNNADWDGTTLTINEFESLFNQAVEQYFYLFETSETDLSGFRDAGGKLIMTHGLADHMIPPQGTIKYYDLLQETMGGVKTTSKFARLFLFPGLDHSLNGPGAKPDDVLGALMLWVEKGKAPKFLNTQVKDESGQIIRKKALPHYSN